MTTAPRTLVQSARFVRPRPRYRRREALSKLLCAASGYLMVVLIYAPIVWLAVLSFSDDPLSGVPRSFTTRHYGRLFSDVRWAEPLQLSLGLALGVGLGCMLMATLVGRALPRARARGSMLVGALLPLFLPGVVLGTALFLYLRSFLGLKLGLWSLAIGHFVWAFPFALLAVLVMASRFDARLLDAAADLGANRWQRFWHIEYPALRPAIIAAGLFGFLLSFNELPRSIFLRGRETTLPLYVWAQASSHTSNVPLIYALSTVVLLVSLAVITSAFWLLFARGEAQETKA